MKLDEELDRLYGSPLADFTRIRNDLAKELGKAGEREAAAEVKALAKPSISAWTVNQLARTERMQVRSLLTASEHVREAQANLMSGGSPTELQKAVVRQREVVGALLGSAKSVLSEAGHPATEATLERIRKSLTAVAGNEEGRRLVEAGRLVEDLEPAGFGPPTPGVAPAAQDTRRQAGPSKRRIEAAQAKLKTAQADAAEVKERIKGARSEARKADRAARETKRALEKEERELERLAEAVKAAKTELEDARSG